jgi:hypothetical protein
VQWHLTLPLRFKLLTKAYQQQEKHVAKLQAQALERGHEKARDLEMVTRLRTELREAWAECRQSQAECDGLMNGKTASGLSPAQVERLARLGMYAGKLAAEANKALLFGWASQGPGSGRPVYVDVERGMGCVLAAIELMDDAGDVRGADVRAHAGRAKERVRA